MLSLAVLPLLALVASANSAALSAPNLIAQTTNGPVSGSQGTTVGNGTPFTSWRGIPFAEPPLGPLRFAPPVPKTNWTGTLDATRDGNICIQNSNPVNGSEDCLFINVYAPANDGGALLPVLFWIYGGGFEGGSSVYSSLAPDYLLEEGVIFVSFNYRLGILGFAATGDSVSPGNNGLKDQVLALQWVRDNIRNFGGDPIRVTLAGQSAGAASIAYHLQSPLSVGLFQAAIMESGTSLSGWAYSVHNQELVKTVATAYLIDTTDSQRMIDGLRTVDAESLQTTALSVELAYFLTPGRDFRQGFAFGPVSEPPAPGAFFSGRSHEIMSSGEFQKVPTVIGFNSLEGLFNFSIILRAYLVKFDPPQGLVPYGMNVNPLYVNTTFLGLEIKDAYFGSILTPVGLTNLSAMQFLSDDLFVRPTREFVRLLVENDVPTYFYLFSYRGVLWEGAGGPNEPGVGHSGELGYLFRSNYSDIATPADIATRQRMVKMWTSFVKTLDPTPESGIWTHSGTNFDYLDIGDNPVMYQNPEAANMTLWDNWYDEYGNPPYTTY